MKLYELEQQYLNLLNKIENDEISNEFILDSLEAIEGDINIKIDNIACIIKQLQAEAEAIKQESIKLNERASQKILKSQKLTEYIQNTMQKIDKNKIETTRNVLQIKKNPASVIISDGFIDWAKIEQPGLIRIKTIEEADKTKIKEYLQNNECKFAKLEQKEKLTIK